MSDWLCSLDTPEEVYNALERNYSNHTISPSIDQVQIFDTATNTLITKDVLGDEFFSDKNSTWESYLKSSF